MRKVLSVVVLLSILGVSNCFLPVLMGAISAIGPVLSMFKTSSSTTFGALQQQSGFKSLETTSDFGSGSVHETKLPKMFAFWARTLPVSAPYQDKLAGYFEAAEWEEFLEPYHTTSQDLKFADGKGKIYNMRVVLKRSDTNPEVIMWEKVLWGAKFEVPQPFMIVTKTKSSFFSSKTTDEVKYFQANLNPEHIEAVKSLAIPFISISSPSGQSLLEKRQ